MPFLISTLTWSSPPSPLPRRPIHHSFWWALCSRTCWYSRPYVSSYRALCGPVNYLKQYRSVMSVCVSWWCINDRLVQVFSALRFILDVFQLTLLPRLVTPAKCQTFLLLMSRRPTRLWLSRLMDNHGFGELDCNSTSVTVSLNSDWFLDFLIMRNSRDAKATPWLYCKLSRYF